MKAIMSGPLFFELLGFIIITVSELMAVEHAIKEQQFDSTLILTGTGMLINTSTLSFLCNYSEHLTTKCNEVASITYSDLLWYGLPVSQQKLLTLPLSRAKGTFRLDGFGIFNCSMEVFLKVNRTCLFPSFKYTKKCKSHSLSDYSIINFLLYSNAKA